MKTRCTFLLITGLFCCLISTAQTLEGTWQGIMPGAGGTFLQVNIQQRGQELCGFTYDHTMYDKGSFCRARFQGRYDIKSNMGLLIGTGFIQNSGSHVLMRIRFWREQGDNKNVLRALYIESGGGLSSFFGGGGPNNEDAFILRKVAVKANPIPGSTGSCFPKLPPPVSKTTGTGRILSAAKPVTKQAVKPSVTKPAIAIKPVKKPVTKVPASSSTVSKPVPVQPVQKPILPQNIIPQVKSTAAAPVVATMKSRKQSEQGRVIINTRKINLKLYDNGTVDNDSISVFYNGRLLLSHQRLSEKAITLDLDLDAGTYLHQITMFAENLGSIPPNTALVVVTAGDKRFELRSKASLDENAVLVFEYHDR